MNIQAADAITSRRAAPAGDEIRSSLISIFRGRLRTLLPGWLKRLIKAPFILACVLRSASYDLRRYYKWSSAVRPAHDEASLAARITLDYHRIEKALALPVPRPGFGRDMLPGFLSNLRESEARYGNSVVTSTARNALVAYQRFNRQHGIVVPEVDALLAQSPADLACGAGGSKAATRAAIQSAAKLANPEAFFANRFSIRNFTDEPIARDQIERAILMARSAPSVCNRQSARVYVITDEALKKKALSFQNGNRGFGHVAPVALIVTADMRIFTSIGERNQCWIDGALFAMSLQYAFHSLGLGSCMLNWSVEASTDDAMRAAVGIPENEAVIMMMVAGQLPEKFEVAQSPRRTLAEIAKFRDRN